MSWNGKYGGSIKYSIEVLNYWFLWISCLNCYWSRSSWVSRLKTIFNLYVFFFPLYIFFSTLHFFHELEWQIPGVYKIQHWGLQFWIPLDYLHKLCLQEGLIVFTFENHLQLPCNFLFTTYFFHELEWEIQGVRNLQQWVPIFWIPLD